jgi:hypothetical protein
MASMLPKICCAGKPFMRCDDLRAFEQSRPQHGVSEIGLCLG